MVRQEQGQVLWDVPELGLFAAWKWVVVVVTTALNGTFKCWKVSFSESFEA